MVEKEKTTKTEYYNGVGRRKTAIAAVRLYPGKKDITLNGKKNDLDESVLAPILLIGKKGDFGLSVKTIGGGTESQKDAIRLGISRALVNFNEEFRTTLKKAGFLTRDPREKERKKPGLKGARRAPQWSKR